MKFLSEYPNIRGRITNGIQRPEKISGFNLNRETQYYRNNLLLHLGRMEDYRIPKQA